MNPHLAAIAIACFAFPISTLAAPGGVTVTGQIDVNAMQGAGQVGFSSTPYDIGSVALLFDGQTSTLYRSANTNPAWVLLTFTTAQAFREFHVLCSHASGSPAYQWKIETANTAADLNSQTGSYALTVGWTGTPSDSWSTVALPSAVSAKLARLTVQRLTGDNYVHINEWKVFTDVTVRSLMVSPSSHSLLPGASKAFTATGMTATNESIGMTDRVTWSSSATGVATIAPTGIATALAPGDTTIQAVYSTLSGTAALHVDPDPTDLDVTYISRTPRYNYDASKNNPAVGDPVVFAAHARNWGGATLSNVGYRWELDGATVATGTIASMPGGGAEQTLTYNWNWQSGNHTIGFRIDPAAAISEASELNNLIVDRTNAIIAGFWVEQSVYNYFHNYQRNLNIGSNSWEDWIQRQMAKQNELYANAVYPSSPLGVLDRVRIDKIVIVPDGALPLNGGLPTNNPDYSDKTVDLMWGFPASGLNGSFYADKTTVSINNPFYIEQSLIHELGHARYLIDSYGFDVHNTYNPNTGTGYNSVLIQENGVPIAGTSLMPFIAFNEVLYYNKSGGVMTGPYLFNWSPYEAAALNLIAGRRAQCGNYNAPCNIGAYINDLPASNHFRFTDTQNRPLVGANVKVYRAVAGSGWYGKTIDNTPDLNFTTDAAGYAHFPRNPFSSGSIQHTYGIANGVAVLRIQHTSGLWFRFIEVSDFNMQYWAGNTQDAYYTISLAGAVGCLPPDLNCDTHVDNLDYDLFAPCTSRANVPHPAGATCDAADFDNDGDVDAEDFGVFQRCYSGPGTTPNPACLTP